MQQPLPTKLSTPQLANTSRSAALDVLKVIAILGVVFIHGAYLFHFETSGLNFGHNQIRLFTNSLFFCVPVFICLWAYFAEKSIQKRGPGFAFLRFYRLLIPFLFWSVIYFLLLADFKHGRLNDLITKHWLGYGWSGQYYFIILFQLLLLFPIISKITRHLINYRAAVYIASLLFFIAVSYSGLLNINIVKKAGDRVFIYWLPYVLFGVIMAHNKIVKFRIPVLVAALSTGLIALEIIFHPQKVSQYLYPSIFIVAILIFNSALGSQLSYASLKPRLAIIVQVIAQNTLGIFCINPLIILICKPLFKNAVVVFPGCTVIMPVIAVAFITCICLLIITLLKKIKLSILVAN